jgi:hypothetical protein
MAAVNNDEILSTWRALAGTLATPGWRSIDLLQAGSCRLKLAKHSPGNEEAILIGFSTVRIGPSSKFPQGRGFRIERTSLGESGGSRQWLAIVRQPEGGLELFAAVILDLAKLVEDSADASEDILYQKLLGRVRGWQDFMRKGRDGLSPEAEQGLAGELCFLSAVLDENTLHHSAVDAWKGPQDGLHDFLFSAGSVEVKSTLATEGFPVRIASLDQLDDSQSSPLYLAALRLTVSEAGKSLPEHIAGLRGRIGLDPAALRLFEDALHDVGYLDMHGEMYSRRFLLTEFKIFLVNAEFPRLIPFTVPGPIRHAQYELDLSLHPADNLPLAGVLQKLGAI